MSNNPASPLPPPPIRRQVSGRSMVSEVTLRKYFLGRQVMPVSKLRIETALKDLGFAEFIRTAPGSGSGEA